MSEFTLRQLEYFLAAIEHGSVTAAAEAVHISQAAASMALTQLEHDLGVDLLIRRRAKPVLPTPAGREFATYARRVMTAVAEMEGAVTGSWNEMRGAVRVGCMGSLSARLMPQLVAHFAAHYPDVALDYQEGNAGELQQNVLDGRLDLAFVYSLQQDDEVHAEEVTPVHHHLMLGTKHHLAECESVSFRQVADEYAILLDMPPTIERVSAIIRSAGVEPQIRWCSVTLETVRSLVARGLGYSVINALPDVDRGPVDGVVTVPINDPLPANSVIAALPPGVTPPRRAWETIRFLREHFGTDPGTTQ